MAEIQVTTQDELDAALARPDTLPVCVGRGSFTASGSACVYARELACVYASGSACVYASGSACVDARESACVDARGSACVYASESARVYARGSARVEASGSARVEARESARVEARGSARVEARGSARVYARGSACVYARESARVDASGSARVDASGSARVDATKFVAIHRHDTTATVNGGVLIDLQQPRTVQEWCEYYGAKVEGDVVTLYHAVDDGYCSPHQFCYRPGTAPKAPDWDGGVAECGGGLHFCARPADCLRYFSEATRFVACPVLLASLVVHCDAVYPDKIKGEGMCRPIYEVDLWGDPVTTEPTPS